MLTIKEPISLRAQRPIGTLREDMSQRVQANYGLMNMPIRKEELLHITSESPEIYFGEGDSIQIFNHIKNENQQELRLDVINNLINRIMVSQTDNFTYQDTVYISSVLRKLGIRDEKTFMKQVFALQNEHKETRQLLKTYENNQEMLRTLFTQQTQRQILREKESEQAIHTEETKERYFLHDRIFNRLGTGQIYQDMRAFTKGILHSSRQIFRNEYAMGEQVSMANHFHLHQLRQELTQTNAPLQYFHNNQYEYLQESLEEMSQTVEEQITAAILLNLTDQSYSLRQQEIEQNNHRWYTLAGGLFQTVENTWKRYETNLTENRHILNQAMETMEMVNQVKRQEGDTIQQIAQEFHTLNREWKENTEIRQRMLEQNILQESRMQENNYLGGSYHITQEELNLQYLQQAESVEEKAPEEITAEQLQKQLEVFRQKNFENYQRLTEVERYIPRVTDRKVDRKKAQRDALRALENPEEVLTEFIHTEVYEPEREAQRELETKLYEVLSEETKEIYRQYLEQTNSREKTFLHHVMDQPMETHLREEIVYAYENVMQSEHETQVEKQLERVREIYQPEITQKINQQIYQQMLALKELQNNNIYHELVHPIEVKQKLEAETALLEKRTNEVQERLFHQQERVFVEREMPREKQFRRMDFVHKEEAQLFTDELLENIQNRQKTVTVEQTIEENALRQKNALNQTVVQNTVNRTQVNQIEDIEEVVRHSVKSQLNQLSDQVYGKIEKKLASERKRRGY